MAMPALLSLSDVREVRLPLHSRVDGDLSVLEKANLPFPIARLFFVRAGEAAMRGQHAHKLCNQFMMCVHGSIEVVCDDGIKKQSLMLDAIDKGVFVPASIWAAEIYRHPQSVLMVACDRAYEEADYICNYDEFRRYRGAST
jgi:UDP-2-acetamido-3-amino-2,3-dideoxy-glucuronate N-acetyltransferase